jgi:type VI secretion system secreted protein VgrG
MNNRFLQLDLSGVNARVLPIMAEGSAALCDTFYYTVTCLSHNKAIASEAVLGKRACLQIVPREGDPVLRTGIVTRFGATGLPDQYGWQAYQVVVEPWDALLRQVKDCRGFVNKSVVDIAKAVYDDHGFYHYRFDYLTKQYDPIPYTVQYNESSYDFLQRLLCRYGIYSDVVHRDDGIQSLYFGDDGSFRQKHLGNLAYEAGSDARNDDPETRLLSLRLKTQDQDLFSAAALKRLDHETRQYARGSIGNLTFSKKHPTSVATKHVQRPGLSGQTSLSAQVGDHPARIEHHYPGIGETPAQLKAFAELNAKRQMLRSEAVFGSSGHYAMAPGARFQLTGHPIEQCNGQYTVEKTHWYAEDFTGIPSFNTGRETYFSADFKAFRQKLQFVPPVPSKPVPKHTQLATVRGPDGKTVYANEHGAVKIEPDWDHHSQGDLNQLPWARVKQSFAGNGYGNLFLPRIGEKVIIAFSEDIYDEPVVIGSLPHEHQRPAFKNTATQVGYKSQTLDQDSSEIGHQLRFDNTADQETFYMRSQKDLNQTVAGHTTHTIGNDHQVTVHHGDWRYDVTNGRYILTAGKAINLICGTSQVKLTPLTAIFEADKIMIDDIASAPIVTNPNSNPTQDLKQLLDRVRSPYRPKTAPVKAENTFEGIETIKVNPRWRCIAPKKPMNDFSTLMRLPMDLQKRIIDRIASVYADKDPFAPEPAPSNKRAKEHLNKNMNAAMGAAVSAAPGVAEYEAGQSERQEEALDAAADRANMTLPKDWHDWTKLLGEDKPPKNKPKKGLFKKKSTKDTTDSDETIKNSKAAIMEAVKKALQLDHAPHLREGWIYIFAQCKSAPGDKPAFKQKMRLFKEYYVRRHGEKCVYEEVDLAALAGADDRKPSGFSKSIELPYRYVSDKTKNDEPKAQFDIQVFFSSVQLSWPRVHLLGGLDEKDPRITQLKLSLDHAKTHQQQLDTQKSDVDQQSDQAKSPDEKKAAKTAQAQHQAAHEKNLNQYVSQQDQLDLINKLKPKPIDDALRNKRAGQILKKDDLDRIYQVQYNEKAADSVSALGTEPPAEWEKQSLYYKSASDEVPTLLLDDPLGLVLNGNGMIYLLHMRLNDIINELENDEGMRTALLAYHFFFNLRAEGVFQATDRGIWDNPKNTFTQKKTLFDNIKSAQPYLSLQKMQRALKQRDRDIVKALMKQCQQTVTDQLNSQTTGPWANNQTEVITDYFAQSTRRYATAHASFYGLWHLTCLDVDGIDANLTISHLPPNTIEASHVYGDHPYEGNVMAALSVLGASAEMGHGGALSAQNAQRESDEIKNAMNVNKVTSYTETVYEQDGYRVVKKQKLFTGNQLDASEVISTKTKDLEKPAGYQYLKGLLKNVNPIAKLVFPDLNLQPQFTQDAYEKCYFEGKGAYNAEALSRVQQSFHTIVSESLDRANEVLTTERSSKTKEVAGEGLEKISSQYNTFIDGLVDNVKPIWSEQSLSEKIHIKQLTVAMICDVNGLGRDSLVVGGGDISAIEQEGLLKGGIGKTLLAMEIRAIGQRRYWTEHRRGSRETSGETLYQVYLDSEDVTDAWETPEEQKQRQVSQANARQAALEKPKKLRSRQAKSVRYVDTYQEAEAALSKEQLHEQKALESMFKKHAMRWRKTGIFVKRGIIGAKIPLSSAICWLAWDGTADAFFEADEQPDCFTISYFGLVFAAALKNTKELAEYFSTTMGLKSLVKKFTNNVFFRKLSAECLFAETTSAFEVLAVLASVYRATHDILNWHKAMSKNDPTLAWSNFMGFTSQLSLFGVGAKEITHKVASKVATPSSNVGYDVFTNTAAGDVLTVGEEMESEGFMKPGAKYVLLDCCEFLGRLVPGVNILFMTATVAQIASLILTYYQDNDYQTWAKKSNFSASENYPDKFSSQYESYKALLNLTITPSVNIQSSTQAAGVYHVLMNSSGHGNCQLSSYLGLLKDVEKPESINGDTENYVPLTHLKTRLKTIIVAETLQPVGLSQTLDLARMPLANFYGAVCEDLAEGIKSNPYLFSSDVDSMVQTNLRDRIKALKFDTLAVYATGQQTMTYGKQKIILPDASAFSKKKSGDKKDFEGVLTHFKAASYAVTVMPIALMDAQTSKIRYDVKALLAEHQLDCRDLIRINQHAVLPWISMTAL